ncbi:MAG: hypothetical protein LQ343_003298 [Gyalolechia ehrenbergii]|nr:MAG: hypothetical protein LQ343_003298 [Gyalolechia ehrenbergii]
MSSTQYAVVLSQTYESIEKVLAAFLDCLKIAVDGARDTQGHHSYHWNLLQAFNGSKNPLFRILQVLPSRKFNGSTMNDTSPLTMIESLRKMRNEVITNGRPNGKLPAREVFPLDRNCSYLCCCTRIFSAFLASFVICAHGRPSSTQEIRRLKIDEKTSVVRTCLRVLAPDYRCKKHASELSLKASSFKHQDRQRIYAVFQYHPNSTNVTPRAPHDTKEYGYHQPCPKPEWAPSNANLDWRFTFPKPFTTTSTSTDPSQASRNANSHFNDLNAQDPAPSEENGRLEQEMKRIHAENTSLRKELEDTREQLKHSERKNDEQSQKNVDRVSNRLRWAEDTIKSLQAVNQKLRDSTEKEIMDAEEKLWGTVKQRLADDGMMEYLRGVLKPKEADLGVSYRVGEWIKTGARPQSSESGW